MTFFEEFFLGVFSSLELLKKNFHFTVWIILQNRNIKKKGERCVVRNAGMKGTKSGGGEGKATGPRLTKLVLKCVSDRQWTTTEVCV